MKNLLIMAGTVLLLQGCTLTPSEQTTNVTTAEKTAVVKTRVVSRDDHLYYYVSRSSNGLDASSEMNADMQANASRDKTLNSFVGERSFILSEVVSEMAEQLISNLPMKLRNQSIALTSIVDLHDHKVTNWLGQTISEQFIHELHIRNIQIIDFKITGNIQLTAQGEFVLTRDWQKLNKKIAVHRILTGTMSRNDEGVMLNVRIVNIDSRIVESTSSAFIPDSMFVGGDYDYQDKKYISRNNKETDSNMRLVRLAK